MGGVLIDDDDALSRLRHDIGLVHLRARGAERPVEEIGLGRIDARVDARIGGGAADVERRLRRLRQARCPMAARR